MNAQALATELMALRTELRTLKKTVSQFQGIAGITAGPKDMVDLVSVTYDAGTRITSLAWLHTRGATYRVETSPDLVTWTTVTGGSNVAAATTGNITTFNAPALAPGTPPITIPGLGGGGIVLPGGGTGASVNTFYRVRRNPYVCIPAV